MGKNKTRRKGVIHVTRVTVEKIGLVSDYSEQGDWAFDVAFGLAKSRKQLNIFRFLESPFDLRLDITSSQLLMHAITAEELVAKDKELREYYDDRLGDYENVGFRICESGRHNLELHRCLKKKDYQLLVIPYVQFGATFSNMPIEEFAYRFTAPVILVGPRQPIELHLNPPAALILDTLDLEKEACNMIRSP
jgi:hypothetical protein